MWSPPIEAEVPVPKGSVGPGTEGPFPEETVAPRVQMEAPPASPKTTPPIVNGVKPWFPASDLFTEPTQPSPFLAIT